MMPIAHRAFCVFFVRAHRPAGQAFRYNLFAKRQQKGFPLQSFTRV